MISGGRAAALATALVALAASDVAAAGDKRCPSGVDRVRAQGRVVWCAPDADTRVVTQIVWSPDRHAIAFATERGRRETTLEVVLIGGGADRHSVSWPIPERVRRARGRNAPAVTWLGPRRVGFGYSEVRPALVASWTQSRH